MKLFIDDWKRASFGYDPSFEGERYHMVQDKGQTGYRIETNLREVQPTKPNLKKVPDFAKKTGRKDKDVLLSLNDSRFENIDKSPSVISSSVHTPGFSFKKHSERVNDLFLQNLYTSHEEFGKNDPGKFYDGEKERTMRRLNAGISDQRKIQSR